MCWGEGYKIYTIEYLQGYIYNIIFTSRLTDYNLPKSKYIRKVYGNNPSIEPTNKLSYSGYLKIDNYSISVAHQ